MASFTDVFSSAEISGRLIILLNVVSDAFLFFTITLYSMSLSVTIHVGL